MSILQNEFTTPEQSKQLLEIGVPADSADCYYDSWKQVQWRQLADLHNNFFDVYEHYIPCWSVGRLIEIFELCTSSKFERIKTKCSVLTDILWQIEIYVTEASKGFYIDFSKLEDEYENK